MVNGWQINDIMSIYSGTHFTVQSSKINSNVINLRSDRPDWLSQGSFTQSLDQWFDTTAFRLQAFGHAGNEGRNKFTMPGGLKMGSHEVEVTYTYSTSYIPPRVDERPLRKKRKMVLVS